jgi:hypothetical protein
VTAVEETRAVVALGQVWQANHSPSTTIVLIDVPDGDEVSYLYCETDDGTVNRVGTCRPDVFTNTDGGYRLLPVSEQDTWMRTAVTAGDLLREERQQRKEIQARLTTTGERLAEAQRQHERRLEAITEVLHREANSRQYCGEFDEVMEEMGLRPRERDFDVTVYVRLERTITVSATSEDAAYEQAGGVASAQIGGRANRVQVGNLDGWYLQEVTTSED